MANVTIFKIPLAASSKKPIQPTPDSKPEPVNAQLGQPIQRSQDTYLENFPLAMKVDKAATKVQQSEWKSHILKDTFASILKSREDEIKKSIFHSETDTLEMMTFDFLKNGKPNFIGRSNDDMRWQSAVLQDLYTYISLTTITHSNSSDKFIRILDLIKDRIICDDVMWTVIDFLTDRSNSDPDGMMKNFLNVMKWVEETYLEDDQFKGVLATDFVAEELSSFFAYLIPALQKHSNQDYENAKTIFIKVIEDAF